MVSASTRKGCYISILNIIQGEVDPTQVNRRGGRGCGISDEVVQRALFILGLHCGSFYSQNRIILQVFPLSQLYYYITFELVLMFHFGNSRLL